jgi:hypothetical protein
MLINIVAKLHFSTADDLKQIETVPAAKSDGICGRTEKKDNKDLI